MLAPVEEVVAHGVGQAHDFLEIARAWIEDHVPELQLVFTDNLPLGPRLNQGLARRRKYILVAERADVAVPVSFSVGPDSIVLEDARLLQRELEPREPEEEVEGEVSQLLRDFFMAHSGMFASNFTGRCSRAPQHAQGTALSAVSLRRRGGSGLPLRPSRASSPAECP